MSAQEKYAELCQLARQNAYLHSTMALLEWDQQTKLPKNAGAWRADQLTFVAGELHRREINPRIGELLNDLQSSELTADPHSDSGATIRELKRDFDKKTKLPTRLVEAIAHASATGQQVWINARQADDFGMFAPSLKEMFALKREQADAIGFEEDAYDALLDDYEPGAKTKDIVKILGELKDELVPLIAEIELSNQCPDASILHRDYPIYDQEKFARMASSRIGFDYDRGRLDVTHHPFCESMGPNDVRLTTRYDASFFSSAFFGTLHEAGHGIYEQGMREDQYGLPPGSYCGLGLHESQSRMWENLVGRSEAFWDYFFPLAREIFPGALSHVTERGFFEAVNEVRPSLIRVEADEATYDLHIIIRFELEQAVINGELATDDLHDAWDEKYENYLRIRPTSAANGVLQDIHWSAGLVGYFPTYSLGNIYASQLFDAAKKELGDLDAMFRQGDFGQLKGWLNTNVHQAGHCMSPPELMKKIVGEAPSHRHLMTHLRSKLSKVYDL